MPALLSLPLLISFFSHKGGVGKTTSVQNIAYILVSIFKLKVLVIDLDTQASLTGLVMQPYFKKLAETYVKSLPKKDKPKLTNENTIHIGQKLFIERPKENPNKRRTVFEMFEGEKSSGCNYNLQWVQENFEHVLEEVSPISIPLHRDDPVNQDSFLFIAGDRRIIDIDTELNEAYAAINSGANFASFFHFMPGLVTSLIRRIGKKIGVDLILIDFGPAPSALNRSAVMGSDYFAVNCLPDFLSRWSIASLGHYIKDWDQKSDLLRKSRLIDSRLGSCPKFLGCIISRIKMFANCITLDKLNLINSIKSEMKTYLIEPFGDSNAKFLENPSLIRDFTRLSDRADMIGKAISHLRPQDLNNLQKMNIDDEDISLGANLNMNSYFSSIISLFANLSENHHKALGNIFRLNLDEIFPQKDSLLPIEALHKDSPIWTKKQGTKGDILEVLKPQKIKVETITNDLKAQLHTGNLICDLSGDIYCAFSRHENSTNPLIQGFRLKKAALEEARSSLTEVVKEIKQREEPLMSGVNKNRMPSAPQLNKLCYRISSEIDRNLKRKDRERKKKPPASQEETPESQKNEEKLIEKYLNAYRSTREASADLVQYLRSFEAINTFLQPSTFPTNFSFLGEQSLTNVAHISSQKALKIYVPDMKKKIASLYYEFGPSSGSEENSMILCETKGFKKVFSRLEISKENKKAQPATGTVNKNGKRGNQNTESSHEVITKKRKGV